MAMNKLKKGDTIAGLIWGGEIKGIGGYSEYTVADNDISFRVPKNISLEEAATLPLASMTSWLALFSKDCLAIPRDGGKDTSVLIWGGSSSVGLYAIQIAALHGFKVITTCSPRHFDLVKSLGAKHALDYHDDNVVESIKQAAPGLKYVFDTIGNKSSSGLASRAIDERGGGGLCTAHEADHQLGTEFFEKLPGWVEEGKIKPNKPKVIPSGLERVHKGFQEYRDGNISATKLVYAL
ncbi:Zinc-type alcohol dehydrogenase-like protein [Colletotrichum sp. SAR 10_86]|nr:Zinc-type alcohol dehydrogenase-like protein [Colletotrichum sp. SAR 10_76]KAI8236749.1 Zinc-type alcohol dehydrogenase-like protein [Colletotrichum sp. SAR 10_86]KAI8242149.1 Zinc-type alcohol dehydrogenase-like protein [Colletotrichum sp. SAR 10_77]KAJ4999347.1 Zinc-type alcohol dehydrogenase-like protein [Colletotrichum sp. SAR 10_66]